MKKIYFVLFPALITSCQSKYGKGSTNFASVSQQLNFTKTTTQPLGIYANGTYCATLEYNELNNENNYTCTLLVDIKNNKLIHISKTNCHSFDGSYVTFKQFSERGTLSVETEQGGSYTLTINDKAALGSHRFQCDVCGKEIQ